MPEADEEAPEEEEKEQAPQPPQSDDTRVENMDISDEGEGRSRLRVGGEGRAKRPRARRGSKRGSPVFPPEEGGAPQAGSPEVLEEDEAELELQKQLEKGRRLRQLQQLQQLRDSGEKVRGPQRLGAGRARAGLPSARAFGDRRVWGHLSS